MATSSPLRPGASKDEELDYYKRQYEQLETDLADFQASSKELEEQLERDVDAAEKNERKLKEQAEKLKFEVEEWKGKHKQAKAEANSAQNTLQKEITNMREQNRSLQLRLRDIEVANDDYERQTRNTTSSLEDLEGKLNVAIEKGVLLEEEIKVGEQERESLRIETQRLRDELGDLKVENEITLEKLRLAEKNLESLRARKPSPLAVENLRARSPGSEFSGMTPYSPTASTPPSKSDAGSDMATPPSPPLSDAPAMAKTDPKTPAMRRSLMPDAAATPRPSLYGQRMTAPRHSRGPSLASTTSAATVESRAMKPPPRTRPSSRPSITEPLPRSESLYQMKSLRSRMQKIEERVHSARSKLPANTTPHGSPARSSSAMGNNLHSSITVRRTSKRPSTTRTNSAVNEGSIIEGIDEAADDTSLTNSRRDSHVKRLSYGIPRPASRTAGDRPPSALDRYDRPPSAAAASRPGSRLSMASSAAPGTAAAPASGARPESRTGARTPIGHYSGRQSMGTSGAAADGGLPRRPRSSMGGSHATIHSSTPRSSLHRPSASVSELRRGRVGAESEDSGLTSLFSKSTMAAPPTSSARRTTMEKGLGIPAAPSSAALRKRQSGGVGVGRASVGEMRPPPSRRKVNEVPDGSDDLGETY